MWTSTNAKNESFPFWMSLIDVGFLSLVGYI